ncbi:MAG TPA: SUMF1/EgtB/PvdO family nonheme iron enzyme, partial [Polyangiaceae bacterium]|nr:SUMF1/EgtB/PvdO family nonheme iron enzyme [Polyangiaceae bacterium]
MSALARLWSQPMVRVGLGLTGLGLMALAVARFALGQRQPPERCPPGLALSGERCCGVGQTLVNGACRGRASSCSLGQELNEAGQCVARFGVVSLAGGVLDIGAADWDGASDGVRFPRTEVAAFRLDLAEVTVQRFRACTACVRACPSCAAAESGLPVVGVSPEGAERFCASQRGRLPTAAEWVWAAAGSSARRYPWGNSGLVCRRAAFGLSHGPCGEGDGPELVGSRPDGASPDGVLDLAGNVAEWAREASGAYAARGGSFRSRAAAELKSWSALPDREKALYIGFRC